MAAVGFDEAQVTEPVKSCVLLSEKVPVALNCRVSPAATEPLAGVTAIETSVGLPFVEGPMEHPPQKTKPAKTSELATILRDNRAVSVTLFVFDSVAFTRSFPLNTGNFSARARYLYVLANGLLTGSF